VFAHKERNFVRYSYYQYWRKFSVLTLSPSQGCQTSLSVKVFPVIKPGFVQDCQMKISIKKPNNAKKRQEEAKGLKARKESNFVCGIAIPL